MTTRDNVIPLHKPKRRVFAISGGKGGTGKSTIALNLAAIYAQRGERVLLIDANLGMSDLNLMLGAAPAYSIFDVLYGKPLESALFEAHDIFVLPSLNGSYQLANLESSVRGKLIANIEKASASFDAVLIDTAAGLGANAIDFTAIASEVILVTSTAPSSIADAYACLKVLSAYKGLERAYILPNGILFEEEALVAFGQLSSLAERFLSVSLQLLPHVSFDSEFNIAAAAGVPMLHHRPNAKSTSALRDVARRLDSLSSSSSSFRSYIKTNAE